MSEKVAFRWFHSLLAYALAGGLMFIDPSKIPWAGLGFAFSALMCRVAGAGELAKLAEASKSILNKRKPRQRQLGEEEEEE